MAKRTKKTEKTEKAAEKPAKTKLRIAGLDFRSPGEMNLNYYFARKKSLSTTGS
jgi:hypothetical protein